MYCKKYIRSINDTGHFFITFIRAYNILIGVLNITGNAILIWALRRTGQTKTISFQFIAIMSASDLTIGVIAIVLMTLLSLDPYQNYCWLKVTTVAVSSTFNSFSSFMIFLIALDRYLHMKYLERYSIKFTKKRGYLLVIMSFALALLISISLFLTLSQLAYSTFQMVIVSTAILTLISVIILYHRALQVLRRKAHLITSSIISQNRALGRAAKRVSICFLILTGPIILYHILDIAVGHKAIKDSWGLSSFSWLAYITYLGNGFCSSVIFISQNIKIRRVLKKLLMDKWNRIRSVVGTMETNT